MNRRELLRGAMLSLLGGAMRICSPYFATKAATISSGSLPAARRSTTSWCSAGEYWQVKSVVRQT